MTDVAPIIKENEIRQSVFTKKYDPFTGEGSLIERQKVEIAELGELYLPYNMLNDSKLSIMLAETGNIQDLAKTLHTTTTELVNSFTRERFAYDFEFWARYTIQLQHKEEFYMFHFILRYAQQLLLVELEKMRIAGVPIRIVLLKARQWGGSTLVQMYMFWIQQIHKKNWHLAVCAQDDGAANNISQMYLRAAKYYPDEVGTVTFNPYARSPKNVVCKETGGIIGVGSINNPDQFRSYNYAMIHFSEPGIWKDTPQRTAKQLVTSLRSVIPNKPYTVEILESTAKSVGSFFHDEWLAAVDEKSEYKSVFIPWFKIDMYTEGIRDYKSFIDGMNEYDWTVWKLGATLEGINWYNSYKARKNYDDWMMNNEFPSTPEEAFISGGQRYFAPILVINARKNVIKPVFEGTIHPLNPKNKKDLKQSHFVKMVKFAPLQIWKMPRPIVKINGELFKVINRYCTFADIGGTTKDADFSVITVIDRFQMYYNGYPEVAATWVGHLEQNLFAWTWIQLSWLYDNALAAIEVNSLKGNKQDGEHYLTVLDTIKDYYDNLYIRNDFENIMKDWIPKYGFHMNETSKEMIYSNLRDLLMNESFVERMKEACDEYDWFERKEDGKLGNIIGKHDDIVDTRAGATWLATKYMPPVKLIPYLTDEEKKSKRKGSNNIISEATI